MPPTPHSSECPADNAVTGEEVAALKGSRTYVEVAGMLGISAAEARALMVPSLPADTTALLRELRHSGQNKRLAFACTRVLAAGWSQSDIAVAIGTSRQYISALLRTTTPAAFTMPDRKSVV